MRSSTIAAGIATMTPKKSVIGTTTQRLSCLSTISAVQRTPPIQPTIATTVARQRPRWMPSTREHSQPTAAIHGMMKTTNSSRLALDLHVVLIGRPWRRDSTEIHPGTCVSARTAPMRPRAKSGMRRAPG